MLADSEIVAAVEAERHVVEAVLAELVAAPTTLGAEDVGQEVMAAALTDAGLEPFDLPFDAAALRAHPESSPFSWDVSEKRNVLATWGRGRGRSLILNGHVDVVTPEPTSLWRTAPFEPTRAGDWLYGRGACDMKSGLAAVIGAVRAFTRLGLEPDGPVTIQSVAEEESTGNGTLQCVVSGYGAADGAVVVEPFGDAICVAQTGVLWFDVRTFGHGGHTADLASSASALDVFDRLRIELLALERRLREGAAGVFGGLARPTAFNVGAVHTGEVPSIVPAECAFRARLGFLPGTDLELVRREVEEICGRVAAELGTRRPEVTYEGLSARPYVTDPGSEIVASAARVLERRLGAPPALLGIGATSDARVLGRAGTPTVLLGATGDGWHAADERVWLPSVAEAAVRLAMLVRDWCGVRRRGAS